MNQEESKAGDIKSKVFALEKLATFEPLSGRFMAFLESNETTLADLSRWIALDPVLTGRVLKLANSPSYGFSGQITTINLATVIIGVKALRELVWSISVMDQFIDQQKLLDPAERVNLWLHSNYSAIAAHYLAELAGYPQTGEAYVAGLLHDLGYLVLAQQYPEWYAEVVEYSRIHRLPYRIAEKQVLECSHTEIGAWLGEAWKFPGVIVEAIRFHHTPTEREKGNPLVKIVYLADLLAHSLMEKRDPTVNSAFGFSEGEILSLMKQYIPCNGHDLNYYQEHIMTEGQKLNEVIQNLTLTSITI